MFVYFSAMIRYSIGVIHLDVRVGHMSIISLHIRHRDICIAGILPGVSIYPLKVH